jgi:hypothetical protein
MNRLRELGASQDLENHQMQKALPQATNRKMYLSIQMHRLFKASCMAYGARTVTIRTLKYFEFM